MRQIPLCLLLVFASFSPVFATEQITAQMATSLVINEVQTGAFDELLHEDGRKEFIELHNQVDETVNITGWRLQYFSSTKEDVYDANANPTRELVSLDGIMPGKGFVLFSYEGYIIDADGYFGQGSTATSGLLARSGGHIRLLNSQGQVVDIVGWGTAKSPETKAVPEIKPSTSAERRVVDGGIIDTNDNFADFLVLESPTPQGGSIIELEPETENEPIIPTCDGLIISELVPNPYGTDAGNEFIELYNPTDTSVFLEDCVLKTLDSTEQYIFPIGSLLEAKQYKAFYDNVTDLTLANAAGGEVILIGTTSDYSVHYPADMDIDHSWSLIDSAWYDSTQPTPNATNILPLPQTLGSTDEDETLEPCPEGKYRNPETNRCKNIQVLAASLTPCGSGQARNPDTNRCRNIVSLATSLVPCRAGQERNPETNRCRNTAASGQATCQEGYERNTETNRCRKIPVVLSTVATDLDNRSEGRLNYVFLTIMSVLVFGYGVYEYRRDINNLITKIKTKKSIKLAVK